MHDRPRARGRPAVRRALTTAGPATRSDGRSSFSDRGTRLGFFAPGSGITSAWTGGDTGTVSGASMVSPHVAGTAALAVAAKPARIPPQVRAELVAGATSGVGTGPGAGSPDEPLRVPGRRALAGVSVTAEPDTAESGYGGDRPGGPGSGGSRTRRDRGPRGSDPEADGPAGPGPAGVPGPGP